MKLLIVGSGGREHALAWKLSQDPRVSKIYLASGNAGAVWLDKGEAVEGLTSIESLAQFAKNHAIDLTIVGSEALLVEGIVDYFEASGLTIFGANQKAAQLEGSKRFAKDFMKKYGVKTAAYESFTDINKALAHLETCPYPTVVKASGLAAGKGVIICQNQEEAILAVRSMMEDKRFGSSGNEIVIEEFLTGFECSVLSFCDGQTIALMQTAKDHKTIGENNTGENTGGMGVVSPHPSFTDEMMLAFKRDIVEPTLHGMQQENMNFAGVIFFGLMVNEKGVYLLEYNMRMGDPETQAVLPLMQNSLLDPIFAALERRLTEDAFVFEKNQHAVCVVVASGGYPNQYPVGFEIKHIEQARFYAQVFVAGAKYEQSALKTSGGRVLNLVGIGHHLQQARENAYSAVRQIQFEGMVYRRDIGA
ncbi:MAG: phosphoribosylamine--glycine ligase [Cardiobacteriaceae bacterium]|nr:phosphoribosylamine--glycine ligase [Cardiobacteriaceae bacterium]